MVHLPVRCGKTPGRKAGCCSGVTSHTGGRGRNGNMVRRFNHDSGKTGRMAGFASRRDGAVIHGPGGEAGLVGMARITGNAVNPCRHRDMGRRQ